MLDAEGSTLIDGRNRLKACEMAGVKPVFRRMNGEDPVAFIISANIARRNLSKGQRAMLLVMIYPEPGQGGRGKKTKNGLETGFRRPVFRKPAVFCGIRGRTPG